MHKLNEEITFRATQEIVSNVKEILGVVVIITRYGNFTFSRSGLVIIYLEKKII